MPLLEKEYVYLLGEFEGNNPTGLVKIGRTANSVNDRIIQLNTGNSRKLKKLFVIETEIGKSSEKEADYHRDLALFKAEYGGGQEWFKDNGVIRKVFNSDCKSTSEDYDLFFTKLDEFSNGKYKDTFNFVNENVVKNIQTNHICVFGPPKSGKRIMVQSASILMPYAHHFFITSLDRTDIETQIEELEKFKIDYSVLTNSGNKNNTHDIKNKIKNQIANNIEVVIHYDECDYGSHKNGKTGKFLDELNQEFDNKKLHLIVYSATPEEAIWSDAGYYIAFFKPKDEYKGPEFYYSNNLIEDADPFFEAKNDKLFLSDQSKNILDNFLKSNKRYVVLRLNYKLENKKSAFDFAKYNNNLQDAVDNYLKSDIYVKFIDTKNSFNWSFKDAKGENGSWSRCKDGKYIFVINGTCTRSTEVGFHPDIYAWHDYRKTGAKASTTYGTYAQAIGRVFHYLPDYMTKERVDHFGDKNTKIKLYAEKEIIRVMCDIYSSNTTSDFAPDYRARMMNIWKDLTINKSARKPGMRVSIAENKQANAEIYVFDTLKEAEDKRNEILKSPNLGIDKNRATGKGTLSNRGNNGPDFIGAYLSERMPSKGDILMHFDGCPKGTKYLEAWKNLIATKPNVVGKYVVFEPKVINSPKSITIHSSNTAHNKIHTT